MFFLQINEFNPELMRIAAERLQAPNLQRLLRMHHTRTTTADKEERFGLDPWVQWVSIHTGRQSHEHGIAHLGDVPDLHFPQIWESLDQFGVRSGVWGAMNARRGSAHHCAFFFPDPWTFSEEAYPAHLNHLLALPRYYSKNYGDLDRRLLLRNAIRLLRFCLRPGVAAALLPMIGKIVGPVLRHGLPDYLLFVLFDLINARLFAHYWRRTRPDFSVLFMNSLAHLQHHKWTDEEGLSDEMAIAFGIFDQALGILFDALSDEPVWLVANAFSQHCTYANNEYLYRQRNPERFLQQCGVRFERVEQAMTNDGHLFFATEQDCQQARTILDSAHIGGMPAFHVDASAADNKRLFFQFIRWEPIPDDATLTINDRDLPFHGLFEKVTRRTGSHLQDGDIFSCGMSLPQCIQNHEIHHHIIDFFAAGQPAGRHSAVAA